MVDLMAWGTSGVDDSQQASPLHGGQAQEPPREFWGCW